MAGNLISYARMRKESGEHPVLRAEVPVEYWISLPMPTARWALPGYARFACPALRVPRAPLRLRWPDRWWLLGAGHGDLVAYGRTAALPFDDAAAAAVRETVTLPAATRPVEALLEDLRVLDEAMDRAVAPFFAGEPGDAELRADLTAIVGGHAGAPEVLAWYRALAPDFFRWLEQQQ